jgi:hypothetical protein
VTVALPKSIPVLMEAILQERAIHRADNRNKQIGRAKEMATETEPLLATLVSLDRLIRFISILT